MPDQDSRVETSLADAIERCRDEIIEEWLKAVRRDQRVSGVPLTDLRNALPDYLDGLCAGLRSGAGGTVEESGGAAWRSVAREHALTRVRLGFDVTQLVHEFIVLRRVLTDVAERAEDCGHAHVPILAELMDAAISIAVGSYVEARDYEARRVQAATVGFITHELRNPLNVCVLAAERLHGVRDPMVKSVSPLLDRNLRRISDLVDSVLESAKVEAESVACRPKKSRLSDVLADPLGTARECAERKGLELDADFDPDIELEVDPVLTSAALENLLENAVKYTDEGSVEVSVEDRGPEVVFHVRDSCPGLSEEELGTIFEPFRRGHTNKPGSGLGLAIARRAVVLQGGHIEAESVGEHGCHFQVTLPKHVTTTLGEANDDEGDDEGDDEERA